MPATADSRAVEEHQQLELLAQYPCVAWLPVPVRAGAAQALSRCCICRVQGGLQVLERREVYRARAGFLRHGSEEDELRGRG